MLQIGVTLLSDTYSEQSEEQLMASGPDHIVKDEFSLSIQKMEDKMTVMIAKENSGLSQLKMKQNELTN